MFPTPAPPSPADFDPFPAPPRTVGKGSKSARGGRGRGEEHTACADYYAPQLPRGFDHFYGAGRGGEPSLPHSAGRGTPPSPRGGASIPALWPSLAHYCSLISLIPSLISFQRRCHAEADALYPGLDIYNCILIHTQNNFNNCPNSSKTKPK